MADEIDIHNGLVYASQQGDQSAIGQLYKRYAKAMYNVALRMCGDADDAKDLFHEAFVKAMGSLQQLQQAEKFGGWLKKIVVSECIAFQKRRLIFEELDDSQYPEDDDDDDFFGLINLDKLKTEINRLPPGCRQVFVLFAVEAYGHRDIAQLLGISESTSKSQYQRARKLLRERVRRDE